MCACPIKRTDEAILLKTTYRRPTRNYLRLPLGLLNYVQADAFSLPCLLFIGIRLHFYLVLWNEGRTKKHKKEIFNMVELFKMVKNKWVKEVANEVPGAPGTTDKPKEDDEDSEVCDKCNGTGKLDNGEDCPQCDGTGEVQECDHCKGTGQVRKGDNDKPNEDDLPSKDEIAMARRVLSRYDRAKYEEHTQRQYAREPKITSAPILTRSMRSEPISMKPLHKQSLDGFGYVNENPSKALGVTKNPTINIVLDQWYKIVHSDVQDTYCLKYKAGKCYILAFDGGMMAYLVKSYSANGIGIDLEHLSEDRFRDIITMAPKYRNLMTQYRQFPVSSLTTKLDLAAEAEFENAIPSAIPVWASK